MAAAAAAAPVVYNAAFFDNMRVGETSRKNYTRDIKDLKNWLKANGHDDCRTCCPSERSSFGVCDVASDRLPEPDPARRRG